MPLSMWSNRWSTMPVHKGLEDFMKFPKPDRRAALDFMPGSDVPVIRQPFEALFPLHGHLKVDPRLLGLQEHQPVTGP